MTTSYNATLSETQGVPYRRSAARALSVVLFAVLTAVGAKIAVPLPGTAVPFTLQVVAVLLAGIVMGPRLGAASQLLYLGAGMAGLPVFAAGGGLAYLLGPTGGYLLAFPIAAAIAGWSAARSRGLLPTVLGSAIAVAFIHLAGAAWLFVLGGTAASLGGLLRFLPGDVLKVALAVLVGGRLRSRFSRVLG